MMAEFRQAFSRLRGSIIGWSIGVGAYGLMMVYLFPFMNDLGDALDEFMSMFPPAMSAFFENMYRIGTPVGFIDVYYFSYLHLITVFCSFPPVLVWWPLTKSGGCWIW